jgi:hypothetical protein
VSQQIHTNSIAFSVRLTFKQSFSGGKEVYASAYSTAGLHTILKRVGSLTVPRQAWVGVSPGAGEGSSQTFTLGLTHIASHSAITAGALLINSVFNGAGGCYVYFDRAANQVFLVNDSASGSVGAPVGSSSVLENSQCSITGTAVAASGNELTLTLPITFKPAFAGRKTMYASVYSVTEQHILHPLGGWDVTGGARAHVWAVAESGTGTVRTFTASINGTAGASDVSGAAILVNDGLNGAGGCYVYLDRAANFVYLVNDSGTGSIGTSLGDSTVLENSQCRFTGADVSYSVLTSTSISVRAQLTFKPAFAGLKNVYASAYSATGEHTVLSYLAQTTLP